MSLLKNIKPNKGRTKSHPTDKEKSIIKALMNQGYRNQDILQIINHGRKDTLNVGRLSDSIPKDTIPISDDELDKYLLIQDSYDNLTGLNKFLDADTRLIKAREAMLSAISNFNNPFIIFKEEIFCTLSVIAWTNLLHEKLEQITQGSSKREGNTYKNLTVADIIGYTENAPLICPIDNKDIINNLRDVVSLRDCVEHNIMSFKQNVLNNLVPLFQSCCINFEKLLTDWFGHELTLTSHISLALQFSRINNHQIIEIEKSDLPKGVLSIISKINSDNINDVYALKTYFTTEATNKTNADIHKLIDYNDHPNAKEIAIKKIDTLNQYPFSASQVYKKIKEQNPQAKRFQINVILKTIKNNPTYSCYQFLNEKQREKYNQNREKYMENNSSPKYAKGSNYNQKAINFIINQIPSDTK